MNKDLLGTYTISEEAPKEHTVEVRYQDLKEDKYQKEKVTGTKLNEVVDEAFTLVNEVAGDEEKELKFVGFPSDD